MSRSRRLFAVAVFTFVFAFCVVELGHRVRYGHYVPLRLHADTVVIKEDFGISGISKVYQATLTNFGITPAKTTICDSVSDAGGRATEVAYTIEKWDSQVNGWRNIFEDVDKSSWCQPYPLGIVRGQIISKRLWPGQSISDGPVAIAAYNVFAIGDSARLLVFSGSGEAYPTAPFLIDEHPSGRDVPYRVRH